jgi:hypothetical protein
MEEYVTLNTNESSIEKVQVTQEANQKIKTKVYRKLQQSESSYSPDITRTVNDIEQGRNITLDQRYIVLISGDTQVDPTNFEKARNHNDGKD